MNFRAIFLVAALLGTAFAGSVSDRKPEITKQTRMEMIRLLNAEYAWVKKPLPHGDKGFTIRPNGEITPNDQDLYMQIVQKGPVARPGERVQITNVEFKGKRLIFEVNGGPVKKAKWYQRIQVSSGSAATNVAPGPDNTNAKGSIIFLEFKDYVPEMTLQDVKEMLKPILDFTVKSAAQAYTETLPENVRNAIRDHKVLVGMNKEMVTYAKGRPPQRIRETKEGVDYEEWVFGQAPQDVEFVRFKGDEVIQLKTMTVDGQRIVKTEREVHLDDPAMVVAAQQQQPQKPAPETARPANAPTLRRPGEAPVDSPNTYPGSQPPTSYPGGTSGPPSGPQGPQDPQNPNGPNYLPSRGR
jgi:hypothetical protein